MNIASFQQRSAGIQALTGQLFTASDLPLTKVGITLHYNKGGRYAKGHTLLHSRGSHNINMAYSVRVYIT